MVNASFAITLYGQCCRLHVVGQQVVSDISVVSGVVEVFVACVINLIYVTTSETSIHRHQTPPRYRNAARGSRCTVQRPRFAIRPTTAESDVIRKTGNT